MTSEKDYGPARTAYWHGFDFTGTARLANGLTVQGGTSTGRAVRDICNVTKALPELLGTARVDSCDVTEELDHRVQGPGVVHVAKDRVLVSASIDRLKPYLAAAWQPTGLRWRRTTSCRTPVIQDALGRLPANAQRAERRR
jgi:hypothetical protein